MNVSVVIPSEDPLSFCGVVVGQVEAHYQSQLVSQFWMYLLAGVVIGVLFAATYYFWFLLPRWQNRIRD